jgi:hypothetical protein
MNLDFRYSNKALEPYVIYRRVDRGPILLFDITEISDFRHMKSEPWTNLPITVRK